MELQSSRVDDIPARALHQPGNDGTRLSGLTLRLVRAAYLLAMLSTIAVFVVAIPVRQAELASIIQNLSPAQSLVLQDMGVSGSEHARLVLTIEVMVPALFLAIGLLVVRRRYDDWLAMQVSMGMTAYSVWISPPLNALVGSESPWRLPALLIQVYAMTSVLLFLYMFPDGRLVPWWTRLLLGMWGVWAVAWILLPGSFFDLSNIFEVSLASFVALMTWLATGMGAQLYRFFRVATAVQQQQTKLIIFGSTVAVLGYLVFGFNRFAVSVLDAPRHAAVVYDLIGVPIFLITILAIPIAFAVSIFRYRLWDIDMVINRVIVYATLTAILGGMYSATIALSQRLFVALTGERSDAAIVLTVLVVGATFTYLRGKLQSTVDRYVKPTPDPIKGVQDLGDRVRAFYDLADVERLTYRALDETVRAFRSGSGAVYLLQDGHFQLVHTHGEWTQIEGMSAWLESGGNRYGWIALGPRETGAEYTEDDRMVLQEIADLTGRTIDVVNRSGFRPGRKGPVKPHDAAGGDAA